MDVLPCDPANRRTIPPAQLFLPRDDHHGHRSISDRSWSCHCPAPVPARECHRRAAWRLPIHTVVSPLPVAQEFGSLHRPNQPASNVPVRLLRARRSLLVDTTEDGAHTSIPEHARAAPVLPGRARSDGSAQAPDNPFTPAATQLRTHLPDHFESCRNILQYFGNVFA